MRICERCRQELPDFSFILSTRGASKFCKQCIEDTFAYDNPITYMHIFKELDIPFIQRLWIEAKNNADRNDLDPYRALYIYNAKMKLLSFRDFEYKDSEQFGRL